MTHAHITMSHGLPKAQGLYDPRNEHDACGIGFIANIKGKKSHKIIEDGLHILENLTHRGAVGADPLAGDGAGILIQMPDTFLRKVTRGTGIALPEAGQYGLGMIFLPRAEKARAQCEDIVTQFVEAEGQVLLGWRDVPVDNAGLGPSVKVSEPVIRQVFVGQGAGMADRAAFERKLFVIRKQVTNEILKLAVDDEAFESFHIISFSSRTLLYKGMLLAGQVGDFYSDLQDPDMVSALALVHQRFSTNTFPSWSLAQPFSIICHNGEINTVRGNINWMNARRLAMASELFGDDLQKIWPVIPEGQSDSASFDNGLELLIQGGYSLSQAIVMMVPEAWSDNPLMAEDRRAFYEYHAATMEPWDGPAAMAFTDGTQIGATLDRNGLRPARYVVTDDDEVILSSEVGVLPVPEEKIVSKWRLQPGRTLLIDTEEGRIISDEEIKSGLAAAHPYQEWLENNQLKLEALPGLGVTPPRNDLSLLDRQQAFGYTEEELKMLLAPMVAAGAEAIGSMGTDTPISPLSSRPKLLYTYFKQLFAQVTNPAIDPIREELVMSLVSIIGPRPNLLDLEGKGGAPRLEVCQPIITNENLEKIRRIEEVGDGAFRSITLDITYPLSAGAAGMEGALGDLCRAAEKAVNDGYTIIILSDRGMNAERVAMPALLATAGVHHHLVRQGLRTSVGLVVETGEAREVHHFCVLGGYGAEAINPYLAFETILELRHRIDAIDSGDSDEEVIGRYLKACDKGIKKVMSKMGISTWHSYCGAQIFDAVGLSSAFVDKCFYGTNTAIEGIGLDEVAEETLRRHNEAFGASPVLENMLGVGGEYAMRLRGEDHYWTSESIGALQHSVRGNSPEQYKVFANFVNDQSERLMTVRGLFELPPVGEPLPLDQVEPVSEIVKRFSTGAMSFGSISREAHTTLAIAMNRIGGKSNTGEGGEQTDRFTPLPNGDSMRSAIKQVASGRFGVTAEYLINSDMMQIKVCQGAKPGEGGQLPGHKVDAVIAEVRYSTPGVGLISPPPHHDIYSIEDLAQLIYDLKNVNPAGDVSVKLVSEIGVGTVAAGVAKARADHVTISGFEGGTGASPLTSIKHAGSPWEIGLAETHQTLVLNRLRDRISVQVDGGLRTGRDVVIGALLGADEFGFATAPLIAAGCIMMRKCHLNTCPVGVATQDPVLRKKFTGQPEHVINYFFSVAEEVRELMGSLGFATFDAMIGQMDRIEPRRALDHWKANGIDLTRLLTKPEAVDGDRLYQCNPQNHEIHDILDRDLIEKARPALENKEPVRMEFDIRNIDRTVGAMLSGEIAQRYGHAGLPDDTVYIKFKGSAGQSFGAWAAHGVTLELEGDANDYVGKGLSGGRLVVYPPSETKIVPEESIVIGNTVLYGAIAGECYFRGVAGERFAVRNSGAIAVVEGVGDHGCEYMTGGIVVVLGLTGRNFAAGMSGGVAYVLDEDGQFHRRCNHSMVELEPLPKEDANIERLMHMGGELEAHGLVEVRRDMTRNDAERLYRLIDRHARYTGSMPARKILDHFVDYLPKFVKVMPVDYRRALEEMERQQQSGKPVSVGVGGE